MIESTGETLTIEQRERVAIRALRAELIYIEQHLLLFGEKRSARFCYLAYWELTEAPEKRQDQLYDELLQENKSLLEQAAEEAELAEVQKASAIADRLYLERLEYQIDRLRRELREQIERAERAEDEATTLVGTVERLEAELVEASAIGRLYLERLAANSDEIDRLTAWDAVLCARRVGT